MNQIVIREVVREDIFAIQQIYEYYVLNSTATAELVVPDEQEMLKRWQDVKEDQFPYYVAVLNDEVVGYAYATSYSPRGAYRYSAVWSIYVKQNAKTKGIGRCLSKAIDDALIHKGIKRLIATVSGNNKESIQFHQKNGFDQIGCFPKAMYKFDHWIDLVWMLKNYE